MKKFIGALVVALPVPFLALVLLDKQVLSEALGQQGGFVSSYLSAGGTVSVIGLGLISFALALVAIAIAGSSSGASASATRSQSKGASSVSNEDGATGSETGTVKWFNVNKGFGFITTSEGEDVFVHFRSIRGRGRRSLRQGQSVCFDLTKGDKGIQAENVSVVNDH